MDRTHRPAPIVSRPAPGQYYGTPPAAWVSDFQNYFTDAVTRDDDPASRLRESVAAVGSTPVDRRIAAGNYGTMDGDGEFADPAAALPRRVPMLPDPNAMEATGPVSTPSPKLGNVAVPQKPVVDLNAIPPIVGPQGEKFAMTLSAPKAASMNLPNIKGGTGQSTAEGRPIVANEDGSYSTERTITIQLADGSWVNIPTMFGGKQVSDEQAKKIMAENNFVDPETGRKSQRFASVEEAEAAAQARTKSLSQKMPGRPNGGALSAAGGHDQVSGGARFNGPPAHAAVPVKAPAADDSSNSNRMAALRFLMEAGLGTMAAGGRPGTNTMGAIGEGVLGAIDRRDQRAVQKRQLEKDARSEAREDKRLGMEERRVDLSEDKLQSDTKLAERRQDETERHNKATEEIANAKASAEDRKRVRDLMKSGIDRDQAILNLAQDKAKSDASSYVKDKWGLDSGTPSIDPAGYQKNVRKYLQDANKQFGTNVTLPDAMASGTKEDPIEPTSQEDIDNAPPGTVFKINGKLMVK